MFPIHLLQEYFTDRKKCLKDILSIGIYKTAIAINYEIENVAKQAIYNFYSNKEYPLKKYISKHSNIIGTDEDSGGGFISGKYFEPSELEVEEMISLMKNDESFLYNVTLHYQFSKATSLLNINDIDFEIRYEKGQEIEDTIPDKSPFAMVNISKVFEFRDKNKSEFEHIQFLCYIALKSIIGNKKITTTNWEHIFARMAGWRCTNDLREIPFELKKYREVEHYKRKLMERMELEWNVKRYSGKGIRGIVFSLSPDVSYKQLEKSVVTLKDKRAKLKEQKFSSPRK
ncbi:MAG: hypothetical protein WCK82_02150 [Bacteroidota bacterium]